MEHNEKDKHHHEPTYTTNILVFLILMVLTGLTVSVAGLGLGNMTVPVAMMIATAKASLVVMFFMHLKYEAFFYKGYVYFAIFFLAISLILTFVDVAYRKV